MIGPFVEIRRDYTICFGSRGPLAGLAVWFVALFLTVDREQHEVIEAMVTVVSVFAEVKIKLYIFWQPECDVLLRKGNWPILDHLMLAEQANFRCEHSAQEGFCLCPAGDASDLVDTAGKRFLGTVEIVLLEFIEGLNSRR
jgi:hypothetical protein